MPRKLEWRKGILVLPFDEAVDVLKENLLYKTVFYQTIGQGGVIRFIDNLIAQYIK